MSQVPPPNYQPQHPQGRIQNIHTQGYGHHYRGDRVVPGSIPPSEDDIDFKTPGQLVKHWLMFLVFFSVFVPFILVYAWVEDADPWTFIIILVFSSGLLMLTESKNVARTMAGGHSAGRVWWAMMATVVVSALWGVLCLVILSSVLETNESAAFTDRLARPDGLTSVLVWVTVSALLGWIFTAMHAAMHDLSVSGQMAVGLLMVLPTLVIIAVPIVYLLVPVMMDWSVTMIAFGAAVLLALLLFALLSRAATAEGASAERQRQSAGPPAGPQQEWRGRASR